MDNFNVTGISDISTISRISHSECSQLMGRLDSILMPNELRHHSSFIQNSTINPENVDQGSNSLKKATKSFVICQNSMSEYAKAKLIFECIEDVSLNNNNSLSEETVKKLKELLLLHEIKHLSLTSKQVSQDITILDIRDFPDIKFSYEEKLNIKTCVETLLHEKLHNFLVKYQELGGNLKELQRLHGLEGSSQLQENVDLEIIKWKDQFEDICAQYKSNYVDCASLINEWENIKNVDMNEVCHKRAQSLLLQSQIAEVQAKILKLTCLIKMYKETPKTVDAHNVLCKTLDDKLLEINSEIKRKEDLKKRYLALQNTEYDNILQTYLHLCNAIKKKKQIMQML